MRTTEEIHIRISEDGSRTVSRNITQIGKAANATERALALLKRSLAGVVTGFVLNQLKGYADAYTAIQNKLRLTTTSQTNLNSVFQELVDVSTRSRSSLEDTATLYAKLAVNAKELGLSQRDILQFTEQLSKTIKVSGATQRESEAGITQIGQALASGRLQGDELRSVLENLPAVADVIAKHFKVTRGELRAMGTAGKLSASGIIAAFAEASGSIDEKFAKTLPTIKEGFVLLENQVIQTVGALNDAGGGTNLIGVGLKGVGELLKTLTPQLVLFVRALNSTLDPFEELSDAGKVFATIFITVYSVVKSIVQLVSVGLTTAFKIAGNSIGALFAIQNQILHGDFVAAARTAKESWLDNFTELSKGLAEIGGDLVSNTVSTTDKLKQVWGSAGRTIREVQIQATQINTDKTAAVKVVDEKELERERKALERLQNQLRSLLDRISPAEGAELELAKATLTLQLAQNKGLITTQQQAQYLSSLTEHYRDIIDPIGAVAREIENENMLLGLSANAREVEAKVLKVTQDLREKSIILTTEETAVLRQSLTAQQEYNKLILAQDQILDNTVRKREQFKTQVEALKNVMGSPGFTADDKAVTQADILSSIGIDLEGTKTAADAQYAIIRDMYDKINKLREANVITQAQASEAVAKVDQKQREEQFKNTQAFFTGIASLVHAGNERLFKIGKAAAIASATVSYMNAIMNAYATQPWYVGLAQGIEATVQLGKVIAQLKNTKYESGGGGYMSGGYTGNGAVDQVAGNVHGQEYVLNATATRRIGVANLDRLQRGQASVGRSAGVARAGSAVGGGSGLNVEIYNYGSDKSFDVQPMSEDRVRIIARDVAKEQVYEHAPKSIAGEVSNPNSTVSRSLSRNTQTVRKR